MIQRDYLLRMIAELIERLAQIGGLKKEQRWREAGATIEEAFERLIGVGPEDAVQLSETELLARVMQGEPTQVVRDKTLFLVALFKEAGDVAVAQDRSEEGHRFHLKGLHLLLDMFAQEHLLECPDFVPRVEAFVVALSDAPLPPRTRVLLMHHYERTGHFAKAEDALFAMLDGDPGNVGILDFGIAFCERLRGQSDAALNAGNLPRSELEASLAGLRRLKTASDAMPD